MRSIRSLVIPASFVVAAMTSTVHADRTTRHEKRYCDALTTLNADVVKLQNIGPHSTLHDLRTLVAQIDRESKTVQKEARKIGTPTAKQFTQSVNQLSRDSNYMSETITIEEARSRIDSDLQDVQRNAQALATEAGCPQAAPGGGASEAPAGSATP